MSTMEAATPVRNVVLVHGAFVDGAGWRGVYDHLTAAGYRVTVAQLTTRSLAEDVATTRRALAAQDGPTVLVGHSYGGVVITEAGREPTVAALVYVAAFALDRGESVAGLFDQAPPGAPAPPIVPTQDGFLLLDRAQFRAAFAADVADGTAAFMADSQVPWGVEAFRGTVTEPAWRAKPTWYVVAKDDGMIPPPAQRAMSARANSTVVEVAASHAIYLSQPRAVADVVITAARAARAAVP